MQFARDSSNPAQKKLDIFVIILFSCKSSCTWDFIEGKILTEQVMQISAENHRL